MARPETFNSSQVTLYEDAVGQFHVYKLTNAGTINFTQRIARYRDIIIHQINDSNSERVQAILTEHPQLYAFGKQHRILQIVGTVLDAPLGQPITSGTSSWSGRGYVDLLTFFNNFAKASVCVKNDYRVVLVIGGMTFIGTIVQLGAVNSAMKPNEYSVSLTMYLTAVPINVV